MHGSTLSNVYSDNILVPNQIGCTAKEGPEINHGVLTRRFGAVNNKGPLVTNRPPWSLTADLRHTLAAFKFDHRFSHRRTFFGFESIFCLFAKGAAEHADDFFVLTIVTQ